jgi:hypothetical protein
LDYDSSWHIPVFQFEQNAIPSESSISLIFFTFRGSCRSMASMLSQLLALLHIAYSLFKSHRRLALEKLVLRQQLMMLKQSV